MKQEFKSRKDIIINKLLKNYDSKEVRYLIEIIKQNDKKNNDDPLSNSDVIDSDYWKDKTKRKKKKRTKFSVLSSYRANKQKPNLIKDYLPIEKYLATERLRKSKVTYRSMERIEF